MLGNMRSSMRYLYHTIKDEIKFTDSFRKALSTKLKTRNQTDFLRLEILGGGTFLTILEGCQGFTYKFRFDSKLTDTDYVSQDGDQKRVIFATSPDEIKLLKGSVLDFTAELMRQTFFVKENPNAEISCSCKTSFSPKQSVL